MYNGVVPKRASTARPLEQPEPKSNVVAFRAPVRIKNPAAVALGKLGGAKGGRARAANLSPEERKEIAQRAAAARWAKERAKGKV